MTTETATTTEMTTEVTTPTSQLLPPEIIASNQSVVSSTTVMVAWQPVTGASGYNIYLYREEEEQVGNAIKVSGQDMDDMQWTSTFRTSPLS